MKVIFLDIDGVLNCDKTPNPRNFPYVVDKKLLARLILLLDRTGARVVLTSSWRCDPVGLLAAKHWRVPFVDVSPDRPKSPRCKEILSWLTWTKYQVIVRKEQELTKRFSPSAENCLVRCSSRLC